MAGRCRRSWDSALGLAFTGGNERAMVMGDTVLFEDEVNPVMSVGARSGLERDGAAQSLLLRPTQGLFHAHRRRGTTSRSWPTAVRKVYDKIKENPRGQPEPARLLRKNR